MGFIIEDNIILVDQFGLNVNDIIPNGKVIEWKEAFLRVRDIGNLKEYKVYMSVKEQIYLRPREKVTCALFEDIFGFGKKCHDYDENKIICINQTNSDPSFM